MKRLFAECPAPAILVRRLEHGDGNRSFSRLVTLSYVSYTHSPRTKWIVIVVILGQRDPYITLVYIRPLLTHLFPPPNHHDC